MSLTPGEVFAGFTIERELGAGGMGVVYLAQHPRLPRRVALKLLRTDLGADASFVARFRREAETVARLDHPNIVAIDDSGAENGQLWISMRFIDGTTAAEALQAYESGMPPDRAVHIIERVAGALDFAHRHQVVHRDVKPANILLTQDVDGDDERVFLTDFGVAKAMGEIEAQATALTTAGGVVATLDYAAPEQIEGRQLDGRCDVYALGCVLYKLLTGGIPYPGDTLGAKIYARMHRPPPAPCSVVPTLPTGFDAVVAKALALEPDDRYQTCRELAVAARNAVSSPVRGNTSTERMTPPDPDATRTVDEPGTGERARPTAGPRPSGQVPTPVGSPPAGPLATPAGPGWSGPPRSAAGGHTAPDSLPADLAQLLDPGRGPRPGPDTVIGHRSRTRRRSILAVVAVLVVAAGVTGIALLDREQIAGNASAASTIAAGSTSVRSSTASPSGDPRPSGSTTTTATTKATATVAKVAPVPGLPHSAPLGANIVVVSREYNKKFALYPIDVSTGKVGAAITRPAATAQNPLISPDRGSIIYLQSDSTGNTVRTVAVDGADDRLLFPRPSGCAQLARPAWNPAHPQQLAISCTATKTAPGKLILVNLNGRIEGTLPAGGLTVSDDLSFSRDGRQLVFWAPTSKNSRDSRLYTLRTDAVDAQPVAITPAGSHDVDPDFAPDGRQIAFSRRVGSHAQIAVVSADGSDPHVLTDTVSNSQGPVWSPDGTRIAYKNDQAVAGTATTAGKNELWSLTAANPKDARATVIGDPGSIVGSPAWGNR